MSSYIGGLSITNIGDYKIGSSLYGICKTAANERAKKIILPDFDLLLDGITVFIKFEAGNTIFNDVNTYVTLLFYASENAVNPNNAYMIPISIYENFLCPALGIKSFTLDNDGTNKYWHVNDNILIEEGTTNGTIKVNGLEISIHGLGSAAYTNSNAYATSNHNHDTVYAKINNPSFTGTVTIPSVSDASNNDTAATVAYVKEKTGGLTGLTGAMHLRGVATSLPSGLSEPEGIADYAGDATMVSGDVVLYLSKEYVWTGSEWKLLGDEGSYALKTSTGTATHISNTTLNTLPTLTVTDEGVSQVSISEADIDTTTYTVPNVTLAGTAMQASVSQGVLTLTPGTNTTFGTSFSIKGIKDNTTQKIPTVSVTQKTIGSASNWNAGTLAIASITRSDLTVVVPDNANNNNNNP